MKRMLFFLALVFGASFVFAQEDTGVASYYGDEFNGRKTASGEVYNPELLTAAHRTLRFGTRLFVTNLDNGKTVTVMVNDRGPFVKDRLIDLSKAAAVRLGMIGPGTAHVKIRALVFGKDPPPSEDPVSDEDNRPSPSQVPDVTIQGFLPGSWFVQVGAFRTVDNAKLLASALQKEGFRPRIREDGPISRVFLQAANDPETEKLLKALVFAGRKTFLQLKNEPPGTEIQLSTN